MLTLTVNNLSKTYPSISGPLEILQDVSLALSEGENASIVGPSGCGKSTLLSILGTLDKPTEGAVLLGNTNPFILDELELANFRSQNIGFVFQDHHLLPQCTVLENVLVPFLADGEADQKQIDHAKQLVTRVGLTERLLHRPAQLSGGEKQRVAIARALVRNPRLILADEPTGNLDPETSTDIINLLLKLQREQQSIMVIVTHSMEIAEKTQQKLRLIKGQLQA